MDPNDTIQVIGTTLLLYDHLLTFKDEVRCIWKRRFSGITVVFVVLRYGNLLYCAFNAASMSVQEEYTCRVLYSIITIMQMLTFAGLGLFCSLRVYAVTSRSKIFSALVAALMTVFVVFQVYAGIWGTRIYLQPPPYHGCDNYIEPSVAKTNQILIDIGMGFGLAGELIVQLATWRATFRLAKLLRRLEMPHRLSTLLLRDGTFMYCFLTTWLVTSELTFEQDLSAINTMVISLTVCRFILRLQQVYLLADLTAETALSDVGFSLFAGNIGTSLHFNREDDNEDDLDR